MGSYGDAWLHCLWCNQKGKSLLDEYLPPDVYGLRDVDSVGGVLCDACYDRGSPPHDSYLERLLASKLGNGTTLVHLIALYAYPVYFKATAVDDPVPLTVDPVPLSTSSSTSTLGSLIEFLHQ